MPLHSFPALRSTLSLLVILTLSACATTAAVDQGGLACGVPGPLPQGAKLTYDYKEVTVAGETREKRVTFTFEEFEEASDDAGPYPLAWRFVSDAGIEQRFLPFCLPCIAEDWRIDPATWRATWPVQRGRSLGTFKAFKYEGATATDSTLITLEQIGTEVVDSESGAYDSFVVVTDVEGPELLQEVYWWSPQINWWVRYQVDRPDASDGLSQVFYQLVSYDAGPNDSTELAASYADLRNGLCP